MAHPDHHAIANGMVWVGFFVLVSGLARAAKEVAVAYRYGTSIEVDAYLFVLNLLVWPVAVTFAVLLAVLVPLAARLRHDAPAELPRFRAELLGLCILIGLGLMVIAWLSLPALLTAPWIGLPAATAAIALEIVPALAFLVPSGMVISLFSIWMIASGRHVNTLLEGVPAAITVLAVLTFATSGIEPLVWGTLIGSLSHLASLAIPLASRKELEVPRFTLSSPRWAPFWQGMGIALAGQILMSFTAVVDQFFAANLGAGAIASLGYASRLITLFLGLGATVVSRSTMPIFSRRAAEGGASGRGLASRWARLLFLLGIFVVVIGWGFAPWVVAFLFERGAFTSQDTLAVTEVLRVGLLQIPFYLAGLVLVALLVSSRQYKLIAMSAGVNLLVKLGANWALIPLMGVSGIMGGTVLMYMVSFALLWWFSFRFKRTGGIS